MNTTVNNPRPENMNAANVASYNNTQKIEKIEDFGQKIGGARKDYAAEAKEAAARFESVSLDDLQRLALSKCVTLPNLQKLSEAGAISTQQARTAWAIWRTIQTKPQAYGVSRWAKDTAERLAAIGAVIGRAEIISDTAREIIKRAEEGAEVQTMTAANWPAEPLTFGRYRVAFRTRYNDTEKLLTIIGGGYYQASSSDPAAIVEKLRELTGKDADRRGNGPALSIYRTRAGEYVITPEGRTEIVLYKSEDRAEVVKKYDEDRPALVARYESLKKFPSLRREWNRPRIGEDWRKGENMTPEQFAAALPFRGVEFGNWLNQAERASMLNSSFDGFHDLAQIIGIKPEAVTLSGSLAFAFGSRGHSKAMAHYECARRVINLTKKAGAGCMAHEWFHAVDNYAAMAAGLTVNNFATETNSRTSNSNPELLQAAAAILAEIKKSDYYTRSKNLSDWLGKYWIQGRELTARAFEGVCAVLLNAEGVCSDFLVNCLDMDEFTAADIEHRDNCYPYPTAQEAAALVPYYLDFLRLVFGEGVNLSAAAFDAIEKARRQAEEDKAKAEAIRAERQRKAEEERKEAERKAQEERERIAEQMKAETAAAVATVREVLTDRHFEDIATAYTSATIYAVCHLEGEIYTIKIDKKATRADIEAAPMTCRRYQYCASARRIINRPDVVKCNLYRTAAALCQDLKNEELMPAVIQLANQWDYKATTANVEKAARIWSDTQRQKAAQGVRKDAETTKAKEDAKEARRAIREAAENSEAPAEGLRLVETAEGVAVVGNDWKDTYFNKRQIKAHGCTWNKERKQWEATEPEAVAMVREWFALRQEVQTAAPAPLETSSEIEEPAESLAIAASYDTSDAPAAESNAQREAAKLAEPEQRDGDQWRFVINAVGEIYANGDDLPAFLTLDEAKASNHLQDAWTNPQGEEEPATHILYEYCKIGDEGTNRIAYGQTEAQARWNYANGFFDISHAEAQKPDWLKVGTRFALVDHVTGKPTNCRYTCEAIDEERHTITVPEASDSFRNGSHEFSWLWHWNQFAPISDDPQPSEVCACYDTNDAPLQETSEITEAEGIKIGDNSNESKNGMSQVVIDLRPQVKHQDGHGREKVADVYFRTQVRAYSRQVYGDYSQEAHEAAEKALTAFYSEVVELLKGEGWTLLNESYAHWHNCPELAKGAQYLYVHPDSISGEVNPADIDTLEAKFKVLTTCEYHCTDNYGDIVLTRSEADERMLYRETYTEGIADVIKECTTTKRSNLYKDKGDALGCIRSRIAIQNKRTDLTGHGTGYYRERKAVAGFVQEEYDRLLQAGYIKEAAGQNGRTLCRWINKKEEKELNKARREAEKQAKTEAEAEALQEVAEIADAEGIEVGSFVKINTDGRTAIVTGIGLVCEGHGVILYLDDFTNWCQDCREKNGYNIIKTSDEVTPLTEDDYKPKADIKDDYKKGDRVRHNQSRRVATIEAVRVTREMKVFGEYRKVYRLNFGESVPGPFGTELNGGEFIAEALTLESASAITDPEGRKFQDFTTWNGKIVKAEDLEKWTKFFAEVISNKVKFGGKESTYKHNAGKIRVKVAYDNDTDKPEDMSYCVNWYRWKETESEKSEIVECENGVSIWQAARAMADFHLLADMVGFDTIGEILNPTEKPNYSASEKSGAPQPSAWVTDYTGDDFAKLQSRYEISDDDRDIMGRRFRLTGKDGKALLGELQVFISDYAGNERHAIYYIWDEFMNEVKCNVRPLDWLRTHFTKANGWEPIENSDTFCRHAA
ncbi:MAG: hypothetical protein J6X07_08970 [Prevotella sp.]|nr:hypothetical protein [Prevotella sp.]